MGWLPRLEAVLPTAAAHCLETLAAMSLLDALNSILVDPETPFRLLLAVHVPAGLVSVISGVITMVSPKRHGRHPRFGHIYYTALGVVAVTAAGLAALRWPADAHLLVLGTAAFGLASLGVLARRIQWRGWTTTHVCPRSGPCARP